ncbi:MAG TPA: GNAT family N-acetyltransferase [Bacteriovoracaceae bacterium]|nr:GNAT family N-acetyltransferase [Bacteriovoracaceae bacterium]
MSKNIEVLPISSQTDVDTAREIFFLTSSMTQFVSEEQRENFQYKYFGFYLEKYPELVLVTKLQGRVLGYCLGVSRTDESFYSFQPHLELFSDLYVSFPAHLHINLHPDAQGLGMGQKLISSWEKLVCRDVTGLHIMTSPTARNVSFYRRLGFVQEFVRKYKDSDILFMGKNF